MRPLAVVLALTLAPGLAYAQDVFGTLRGTVRAGTEPIVGSRVTVIGSTITTVTDRQGRYELALIPAGTWTVRAEAGGTTSAERRNVFIAAGDITSLDFSLANERPDSPLTGTAPLGSHATLSARDLGHISADDPRQSLAQVPGVVVRYQTRGFESPADLAIRGSGDLAFYLDGAPVRNRSFGGSLLDPGLAALDQVSVTTGLSAAATADPRGGVIGWTTRTGGTSLEGALRLAGDKPFGNSLGVGFTDLAASLGGPVPGLDHLTWFASATLQGQASSYRGAGAQDAPLYDIGGVDTTVTQVISGVPRTDTLPVFTRLSGLALPYDWTTRRILEGRALYTFGRGASVSLTLLASDFEQRGYPGANLMDRALYRGHRNRGSTAIVNWGQPLGRLLGAPLDLAVNLSTGSDHTQDGPLTAASEAATRNRSLGIGFGSLDFFGSDVIPFPVDDAFVRNMRRNAGPFTAFPNRNDLFNARIPRVNPYGLANSWPNTGVNTTVALSEERRTSVRGQLVSRRRSSTIMVGADLDHTRLDAYAAGLITAFDVDAFTASPNRFGLHASERINLGRDLTVDLGVRYDRFSPGNEFPKVPGRIFTNPAWGLGSDTTTAAYDSAVSRVFDKGRTQGSFSPHIRIGYQPSPSTAIRAGFGRQAMAPGYGQTFSGTNVDLATANNTVFGQDVDVSATTIIEFGVRHDFAGRVRLDLAGWSEQLANYGTTFAAVFDPLSGATVNLLVLGRIAGHEAWGADARLDWGLRPLAGSITYSLASVRPGSRAERVVTHNIVAALGTAAAGFDALATVRINSGLPYNRAINSGSGVISPPTSYFNALGPAKLPWTKTLDLKVSRVLPIGSRRATLFVDARNLLNTRNLIALFAETGRDTNSIFRSLVLDPERATLANEAPAAAHLPDGSIDLAMPCTAWQRDIACVSLRRVEARFGNGDGLFSPAEQNSAFGAAYDAFYGPSRFHGPGRTLRVGLELR
jgi:hypothetical protein